MATDRTTETIRVIRAQERLKQEIAIFNHIQSQDERLFRQRLAMGWVAVVALPLLGAISCVVIFEHDHFSEAIVALAASALLTDILGLIIMVWRTTISRTPQQLAATVSLVEDAETVLRVDHGGESVSSGDGDTMSIDHR
jgi:uncharacterized membrane protein YqjE